MKLAICVATMQERAASILSNDLETNLPGDIASWTAGMAERLPDVSILRNTARSNLGVVGSYQRLYEGTDADVLCFLHDDVICREGGWDKRVLAEFEDENVGIVGFGGALWHGVPELYKVPYELTQLRRGDYRSNVDDAEVHGERFSGASDVAVLDGYALCVRRSLLDRCGGWKSMIPHIDFIGYDYVICCLARRLGYRIRLVGIRCHHRGGGTSVGMNVNRQAEYDYAHRWIYDNFRDVLPWHVR